MKIDPKRQEAELYRAPRDHAVTVDVPDEPFLSIDGHGSPYDPGFQGAIRALYSVAFTIKALLKKKTQEDHVVMPLEALWWWGEDGKFDVKKEKEWRWRLMIRQPLTATSDLVAQAIQTAKKKHPELAVQLVELRNYHEGASMQILHVGPYKEEATTLHRLHEEIEKAGFESWGPHHEIYLGDPRRAKPEKLRTLLREPVRPLVGLRD
ncbi:MAG: GyrI-like domain-containing protein [Candidatus Thermoplasmatota archaeon]